MTTMNDKFVSLKFGNGSKIHLGVRFEYRNQIQAHAVCGSRKSGTARTSLGQIDLATLSLASNLCEKCELKIEKFLEDEVSA